MSDRTIVIVASLTLLVAVAAGAFGAHGLKRVLSADMLAVWHTAVLYQLVHGLGMLAIAGLGTRFGSPLLSSAAGLMFAGIVLFSGSLYLLATTGVRWLGAITPIGGLAFILAWALVALAAWRSA
ncbi:DUF423 domain-containing protein [Candidimonas humi]|uniref:DUF423 domain-containing protein n=1 Tax=Candidimonas humi TaxID=683355 RepID=A0ABV8P1Y9_9BURK|nr:DUF423 domain-containing protein [Candidimonas humi]MBV6306488.1 DUF423 domain-containing protein [Candidimonas humi]